MALFARHLEQIALSAESIASLPFPPPQIFTNALLSTPDITSLIRDTEPHERALFSVPPTQTAPTASTPYPAPSSTRRQTVFNVASGEVTTGGASNRVPRRNTAVAAVLGRDLHDELRKTEGKGEFDVEVLLRGVEKLNEVYEMEGVRARVEGVRRKVGLLKGEVEFYEGKVQRQMRDLERMNRGDYGEEEEDEEDERDEAGDEGGFDMEVEVTDEDIRREQEEIRELEKRKRDLEDRVSGMERDLGGLNR